MDPQREVKKLYKLKGGFHALIDVAGVYLFIWILFWFVLEGKEEIIRTLELYSFPVIGGFIVIYLFLKHNQTKRLRKLNIPF